MWHFFHQLSANNGKKKKRTVLVQLMSACVSLWISCTTTKIFPNLVFFSTAWLSDQCQSFVRLYPFLQVAVSCKYVTIKKVLGGPSAEGVVGNLGCGGVGGPETKLVLSLNCSLGKFFSKYQDRENYGWATDTVVIPWYFTDHRSHNLPVDETSLKAENYTHKIATFYHSSEQPLSRARLDCAQL